MLWVPFFMGFMILLTVTAWTPSLLKNAAMPLSDAALVVAGNNLGSVIGTSLSGYLIGQYGPFRSLVPGFLLGALSLASFGAAAGDLPLLLLVASTAGFFVGGASSGLIALAAALYPTSVRSTGIGWGMGIGRLGQILGPLCFGALVVHHASIVMIFVAAAIPCVLASFAVSALAACRQLSTPTGAAAE
jgi:AAHS family 4-hydroxybenzoate transporter-like MFS transporter